MNFKGPGTRLSQGDFGIEARRIGATTASLLAVTEVEARGRGVDPQGRPIILYEPHVAWRNMTVAERNRARPLGLAYPRWGEKPYQKGNDAQYRKLVAAMKINREAALKACSWGLGQILGENFAELGYASVEQFVGGAIAGEPSQLRQMCTLIQKWGLVPSMNALPALAAAQRIARRWNGLRFAENKYDEKIVTAHNKHTRAIAESTGAVVVSNELLVHGMRSEAVRQLQADLVALGYDPKGVDGRFGNGTFAAVRQFQRANKLTGDGKAGSKTLAAIAAKIAELADVDVDGDDTTFDRKDEPEDEPRSAPIADGALPEMTLTPPVVKLVQSLLRECGYPEVGNADGIFGARTRDAILAFQANNSMALTGKIDTTLFTALAARPMRELSNARQFATAKDLKSATGVRTGRYIEIGGAFAALFGTVGTIFDTSATFDDIERAAAQAAPLIELTAGMSPWIVLAIAGAAAAFVGRRQIADQVAKYRRGNHV